MTLGEIETLARSYAAAQARLSSAGAALEAQVEAVKDQHIGTIKELAAEAAERREAVETAVAAAPHLFERPKTLVLAGIKVGYRKGAGRLEWDDTDKVVARIRAHMPKRAASLIKTTTGLVRAALGKLSPKDLKRLGVSVVGAGDEVVVAPVDSDISAFVKALLSEDKETD